MGKTVISRNDTKGISVENKANGSQINITVAQILTMGKETAIEVIASQLSTGKGKVADTVVQLAVDAVTDVFNTYELELEHDKKDLATVIKNKLKTQPKE